MAQLNQIIAAEKGVKNRVNRDLTDTYHAFQRTPDRLAGISRVYTPVNDEDHVYPPESTRVQVKLADTLKDVAARLTQLFDVTATKEWGNQQASADVVVDGHCLLAGVPVSYLLFLDKQLTDLHTVFKTLPTLDPADAWDWDSNDGVYKTSAVQTTKTKKVPRNHVKAEATDRHPAQVDTYYEDVPIGQWSTVKSSGALPTTRVRQLLGRIEALQKAVKFAREQANQLTVEQQEIGEMVFEWLLAE